MKENIHILTSDLIAIPSITGNTEACKKALDYVDSYLGKEVGSRVFQKNDVYSVLWGDQNTLMEPRLLLSGHIDVVDVEGDKNLFFPRTIGDKIFGRGAGDMKGHVAATIAAYKKWIDDMGPRGVGLLLTSDEETGGFNGTRHVIEQGLKPSVVFIPDGALGFSIVKSQKAPHHFVVEAAGSGGHASEAFRLDNPIDRLISFYLQARNSFDKATKENDWASTFKMTVIHTDNKSKNKIPDKVKAAFSWRWPPEQIPFSEGRDQILKLAENYRITILEEEGGGEGCVTDPEADYVRGWKTIIEGIIGYPVGFINMHGATDGRHFYNNSQFGSKNILVTSAITGSHHKNDEWVDIKSLYQLSEAIFLYQANLGG